MENRKKYDLIIQNSASKKEWVVRGLEDTSGTHLYYEFEGFEMPADAPEGEYYYALLQNDNEEASYELKNDLLETLFISGEESTTLRALKPEIGLFKYGEPTEQKNAYRNKNKDFIYRKK